MHDTFEWAVQKLPNKRVCACVSVRIFLVHRYVHINVADKGINIAINVVVTDTIIESRCRTPFRFKTFQIISLYCAFVNVEREDHCFHFN